jgi:hypothetical protein
VNPFDMVDGFYFITGHVAILVYFQVSRRILKALIIIYFLW